MELSLHTLKVYRKIMKIIAGVQSITVSVPTEPPCPPPLQTVLSGTLEHLHGLPLFRPPEVTFTFSLCDSASAY